MIVLGIDPGFASMGIAVVKVGPDTERILELAVLRTEKSARKLEVRASDDNVRRAMQLTKGLCRLIDKHNPIAIAIESQSWSRDAGASSKVGMAWGVVAAVASWYSLAVVQASPQAIKKHLCGRKNASKEDVIMEIEERFPDIEWPKPNSLMEHAADAIGAVLACLDNSAIQMARKLSQQSVNVA
jgi:Holliday junction resolvasome RuvABC endonuclease subunit